MKKLQIVLSIVLTLTSATVKPYESIKSYHSDITLNKNGSIRVKETIVVHAEGRNIRQGIYRDFPTYYKSGLIRTVVPFEVASIKRNGKRLPVEQKPIVFRGQRVYMRDGTWLQHGKHTFELEYTTARQIGFFDKHDELYWNVVGADWMFPILQSSATVHLPDNVTTEQLNYTAYAGRQGSGNKAFRVKIKDAHTIEFFCTQKLQPHQAFSIVLGMPKGSIVAPTDHQKRMYILQDNSDRFYLFFMFLLACLCIFVTYLFKKRNEPNRPVIPLFQPPNNFTPGMVSYFVKRGYSSEGFAADIVNMGVCGWLNIFQSAKWQFFGKTYVLKSKGQRKEPTAYREPFRKLFSKASTLTVNQANKKQTLKAFKSLKDAYDHKMKSYFVSGYMGYSLLVFSDSCGGVAFFYGI